MAKSAMCIRHKGDVERTPLPRADLNASSAGVLFVFAFHGKGDSSANMRR